MFRTWYLVLGTLYNHLPYRSIPANQAHAHHKLVGLVGKEVTLEHRPLVHVAEAKLAHQDSQLCIVGIVYPVAAAYPELVLEQEL